MYIINNNTLYLYFDGINTIVREKNCELDFFGNVLNKILNDSCKYYGSSYKGRLEGSKSILNDKYKLPVIIKEKNNLIIFPIKDNNHEYWFNFNEIDNYKKNKDFLEITFKNKEKKEFIFSYITFNNQVLKSSRLLVILLGRK